jgi:hypothetical protein
MSCSQLSLSNALFAKNVGMASGWMGMMKMPCVNAKLAQFLEVHWG